MEGDLSAINYRRFFWLLTREEFDIAQTMITSQNYKCLNDGNDVLTCVYIYSPHAFDLMRHILKLYGGADCNSAIDGLSTAAYDGDIDLCRFLVDSGTPVNELNRWGTLPIQQALVKSQKDVVKFFLDRGACSDFVNAPRWVIDYAKQIKTSL